MRVVSWNVNGLRAAERHGFVSAYRKIGADIFCLQEIKANEDQLSQEVLSLGSGAPMINSAQKKGYSGTAVLGNVADGPVLGTGFTQFDNEGRFISLDYGIFVLINVYMPHGGRQKEKLPYKKEAYANLFGYLDKIKDREVVLVGDFNIAHTELDLERPKNNKDNIMFTPEERGILDDLLGLGFVDTFRHFNKDGGNYTWWPYMANARERNLGWRIDYCFVSNGLKSKLKSAFILPEIKGSDHCPVGIDLGL